MNHLTTYIVYLDDAEFAQRELAAVLAQPGQKRWILVACAPRMTRRIGKWLSHSARENWRDKWCDKLFAQFMPAISRDDHVFREVATGPLPEHTKTLLSELGQATVIDARRPKFGIELPPVTTHVTTPAPLEPAKPMTGMQMSMGVRPRMA
jgi:hypothetical protein